MIVRALWLVGLVVGILRGGAAPAADDQVAGGSLQAKFGPRFVVGVALGGRLPDEYSATERGLIRRQFGSVTPENCMKKTAIQPREGEFHFEEADALVAFARENRLQVVGHTLVWAKDDRTPAWVFLDGDKPASRELVLDRMRHTSGRSSGGIGARSRRGTWSTRFSTTPPLAYARRAG